MFTMKTKPAINTTLALLAVTLLLGGCNKKETPQPTSTQAPQANVSAPTQTNAPVTSATPAPVTATPAIAKSDGEKPGLRVEVIELKRSSGDTLTLRFDLVNDSGESFEPAGWYLGDYKGHQNQDIGNVGAINLIDAAGKKKYFVVRDTDQNCVCSNQLPSVNAKSQIALWARFPAPPGDVKKIGVVIPHFIPMDDVPISQ